MPLASVTHINEEGKKVTGPVDSYGCWGPFKRHAYRAARDPQGWPRVAQNIDNIEALVSVNYYPQVFQLTGGRPYNQNQIVGKVDSILDVADYLMEGINNIKPWKDKVTVYLPASKRHKVVPLETPESAVVMVNEYDNSIKRTAEEALVAINACFEVSTDMEPEELYALLLILRKLDCGLCNSLRICRENKVPAKYGVFLAEAYINRSLSNRPSSGNGITLKTGRENFLEIVETLGNTGDFYPVKSSKKFYSQFAEVDLGRMGVKLGLDKGEDRYSRFFYHSNTFRDAIDYFKDK